MDDTQEKGGAPSAQSRSEGPPVTPAAVDRAANGAVTPEDEQEALAFLLGNPHPTQWEVPVTLETDVGPRPLKFLVRQMDGREIEKIENSNRKGAMGELDELRANAELVTKATINVSGVEPTSPEFRGPFADPVDAMFHRFGFQAGLLAGVAGEIRRVSGWAPDRVGSAERKLVKAAGN